MVHQFLPNIPTLHKRLLLACHKRVIIIKLLLNFIFKTLLINTSFISSFLEVKLVNYNRQRQQ